MSCVPCGYDPSILMDSEQYLKAKVKVSIASLMDKEQRKIQRNEIADFALTSPETYRAKDSN